jgi:ribosomal protein S12 methylthiotransferase accessory factor YcaO
VSATGFATTYTLAALKARSELIERIYASDLMQEDASGLPTYRTPTYWCSTGAAAHPDRDICLENSLGEIIERDSLSCWFAMSRTYSPIETVHGVELAEIPCMYEGWHVVISIRKQENRTAIQAGSGRTLEEAMLKAFYESFLRPQLPAGFEASRLPNLTPGAIKLGNEPAPALFLREWKCEDLFVVKQYSHHCGDMRRGVPQQKADKYKEFLGDPECIQIPIHFNWCH